MLEGQGRYEEEYLKELENNWKIGLLDKETTRTPFIQTPIVKTQVSEPIVNNESEVSSPLFSEMQPQTYSENER